MTGYFFIFTTNPLLTKHFTSIFGILAICLFSCCSGSGQNSDAGTTAKAATPVYDTSLPKGRVIDSVHCKAQSGQYYALCLPSYYTNTQSYPCIFFFDAHARGALPLRLYKDLAEKYGFIFIGSDMSKNGTPWPTTSDGVTAMVTDARMQLNIDPKRIYTAGFSGGARVAGSVAIIMGGVAGVIACAAGFPKVDSKPEKFDYFSIVGNRDFNLSEMTGLDEALGQIGFPHQLLTTDGTHEWPAPDNFKTALLWMQVRTINEKLQPGNDAIVAALKSDYDARIRASVTSGELVIAHQLCAGAAEVLGGLTDITSYQQQKADLEAGAAYRTEATQQQQLANFELEQQQELMKQFATENEDWWRKKIAALEKGAHTAKAQEALMYTRLLNYIGLAGYLHANHAINTGDAAHALTYLRIFELADPKNPDCSYLAAVYYAKNGEGNKAFEALNKTVSLGYSDIAQLQTEPAFNALHTDPKFQDIIGMVQKNYTATLPLKAVK
jgi:dienelactone hydrolase